MNIDVHATQVEDYQTCPRRWYLLSYLKREPRRPDPALLLGRLVHAALDRYYYHGEDLREAWLRVTEEESQHIEDDEDGTFDQTVVTGLDMLEAYLDWQASSQDEYADDQLIFLETELDFHVEMEDFTLAGRFDGIVKHRPTGQVYLLENKTCSDLDRTHAGLFWDNQPLVYLWAAQRRNPLVAGVLYTLIRRAPMNIGLLKNGLPSKAVRSSVRCTAQRYKRFLEECIARLSEQERVRVLEEYQPVIDYLSNEAPPFVRRFLYIPHPSLIKAAMRTVREEAARMKQAIAQVEAGEMPIAHRSRFRCLSCAAREVCYAMDTGGDWEYILEQQFVPARYYARSENSDQ